MRLTSTRLAFAVFALCAAALPACSNPRGGFNNNDVVESDVRADAIEDVAPADTGTDAGADARRDATADVPPLGEAGAPCTDSTECDDGNYCNGAEQCLQGFCRAGENPCNDHVECTVDLCVASSHTCRHMANNDLCSDQHACNGLEQCAPSDPGSDPATGCQPVNPDGVLDCNDHNDCTVDTCDDATGCVHGSRDLDGDGHVEQACTVTGQPGGAPGDDCNDTDPDVHPGATEVCDDGKDNDCDGQVDFQDTNAGCVATNDACANAREITSSGTFWTSVNGLHNDLTLSCSPGTANDSVWTFTLTEPSDVRASLATTATGAAVAITSDCGATLTELGCAKTVTAGGTSSAPQLLVRSLQPGTYYVIVENGSTSPFRLSLQISAATMPPPGDVCPPVADALDLAAGTPQTAMLGIFGDEYTVSCNTGLPRNDAVFRLSLPGTSDVDLSVTSAGGTNYVSLRNGPCATGTQTRCLTGASVTTALRNVPAGDYFVFVENSQNQAVTATAMVHDPGSRAPGDNCATVANVDLPATLPGSGTSNVSWAPLLTGSDYGTTCGSNGMPDGWKDAVFHYALPVQSDVTVTITPSAGWTPRYSWQLSNTCGGAPLGACTTSMSQSVAHYAGQPAGDYYLEIETNSTAPAGAGFTVQVSAIDTASRPAYEACPGAPIALTGTGTLTGSTTINASSPALDNFAQSGTSCGSAGFANGWTDVVFSYTLPAPSDVTVSFASDPLRAWFYEFQTTCGSSASRLRPSSPSGVSDCNVHTTGGIGSGAANTYTFTNQPAGTYYLVAETSAPDPGSVKIDVSAVTH